ncbi:hypothetical protein [Paraburkholderia hospita]|uniref:Uncharacterized protein n=1 Tax=Paraburkholderia hospita TaxID=169430 RepID=A0AAN1J414_9BURK|nr:hypothetical protein [Paraburkholderia hospita]AUT67026.1 hypothetical protein C2L64_00715 [Paraburkholderia hospita]SEH40918.1 hypothetical protein SAMN05192544_1001285 [Paraburkholderia hospita]
MPESRVIDTNVLIVASAAHTTSPFPEDGTPIKEPELRERVLSWMEAFESDPERHAVLDWDWHICTEYRKKLTNQDYGWLALMRKRDQSEVTWVGIEVDEHGHAMLPPDLAAKVTDLEDRKMVASVIAVGDDVRPCKLTNACDTDWLDCADALTAAGVETEHLLEDWLYEKWNEKKAKKP